MNQNKTPLFDALKEYKEKSVVPFDVPGHKQGKGLREYTDYFGEAVLDVDVNSMKCLDNLNNPKTVILEAQQLLAEAYGADQGFFLVNGTSSGVQAMIMSVCGPGDKILIPRNAHRSVTNALIVSGAVPVYMQPEYSKDLGIALGVSYETAKRQIEENPEAKAVFIINPTYFGACSDIGRIAELAHEKGMALLADEAHGAHLKFHEELPVSAISLGADMSAVSLHKTGGSMTQSSALLLNSHRVSGDYLKKIINLNQTTSASYILMSSLDVARKNLAINGREILGKALELARYARKAINEIDGLFAFGKEIEGQPGVYRFDETKLVINTGGIGLTGFSVYEILRDEYNIQLELGEVYCVLAIISIGDTMESVNRLIEALRDLSERQKGAKDIGGNIHGPESLELAMTPRDAFYADKEIVPLKTAVGKVSGESLMVYPPGIPVIVPGELITSEAVEYIEFLKEQNTLFTDIDDKSVENIKVIKRKKVMAKRK